MLNFLVHLFWCFLAVVLIFVSIVGGYVIYLMISDLFFSKTKAGTHNDGVSKSTEATAIRPDDKTSFTLLAYLNEHHSPLHSVRYDDHLFSSLDMDSLDIQSMLRYMSEAYDVELPIVDLFSRYGADPTVYQVLCFISRQRQSL